MNPGRFPSARPAPRLGRRALVGAGVALAALLFGGAAVTQAAPSAGYQVIVHPQSPTSSIRRELLADIFLKKASRWASGEPALPVDLRPASPVRQEFSRQVLKRTVAAVRTYWTQRIFSGRELPPPELDNDEAVLRFVTTHPGAVGYLSAQAPVTGAKLLEVH